MDCLPRDKDHTPVTPILITMIADWASIGSGIVTSGVHRRRHPVMVFTGQKRIGPQDPLEGEKPALYKWLHCRGRGREDIPSMRWCCFGAVRRRHWLVLRLQLQPPVIAPLHPTPAPVVLSLPVCALFSPLPNASPPSWRCANFVKRHTDKRGVMVLRLIMV